MTRRFTGGTVRAAVVGGRPFPRVEKRSMKRERILAAGLAFVLALTLSSGLALAAAKPAPAGKVNINTASVQQLTVLPGVGEKLAARIVEYRQKSGGFKAVQELMNVKGVGEKSFAKLQPFLTSGDSAPKASSR